MNGYQFGELAEVRKKALIKFHEQVMNYPELLSALSTENLANLIYDRERSELSDNDIYMMEIAKRIGGIQNWDKVKLEATKTTPPAWDDAIKHFGFNPQERLRQQ